LKFVFVIAGGAIGALLRYGLSSLIQKRFDKGFPWGTLGVNLLGCFLIGFLWSTFQRGSFSPNARIFIFVGMLGAFTTFSTYGLESVNLIMDKEMKMALTNIFCSNILGFFLIFAGFVVSRSIFKIFH
jgi:fluoride exporter